jgi:hypothetical protein
MEMEKLGHQDGALYWRILEKWTEKLQNYRTEDERCNGRITVILEQC